MRDRVIAFDIEMPGQREMRLSALGITVIDKGIITDKYFYLINPETEFDPYVIKLIGITPEMVKDKPTFPEIWEKVKDVMSSGLLVAHGATGDLKALCGCMKDYGIEWKDEIEYTCTCDMGIKCYNDLGAYSLDTLCEHIGFYDLQHHDALSDSEGCARLYLDYMEKGINEEDFLYRFDTDKCIKIRPKVPKKKKTFEERLRNSLLSSRTINVKKKFMKHNPDYDEERVIGVKEGTLRQTAVRLVKTGKSSAFMNKLPHKYLEEDNIHAMLISGNKRFPYCLRHIQNFLPYVDNLQTAELLTPFVFKKHTAEIYEHILSWLSDESIYTVVFAINTVILCYSSPEELPVWFDHILDIPGKDPLIRKKKAEFFKEALLTCEDEAISFFEVSCIDRWTRNMAIQYAAFAKGTDEETRERLVGYRV